MSLQDYLAAKSNKGKGEQEQSDLASSFKDDAMYARLQQPVRLQSPKKTPLEMEEDYSSGAEFWNSARLSDIDTVSTVKHNAQHGLKAAIFRTEPIPNENSVANILRKIKVSASETQNVNSPPLSSQKTKSGSVETLKGESSSSISAQSQTDILLEAIGQQIERNSSSLLVSLKSELQSLISSKNEKGVFDPSSTPLSQVSSKESMIDRPTKNLISSIQEKLIMIAKTQDHEFASLNQRISQLEKRLLKPNQTTLEKYDTIATALAQLESKLGKIERERFSDIEKLEKLIKIGNKQRQSSIASTDEDSDNSSPQNTAVLRELKEMRSSRKEDQKISQERMSQFMELFSALQSVHENLLHQVQTQSKCQSAMGDRVSTLEKLVKNDHENMQKQLKEIHISVKATHETLVSYLPLNLESKILTLESLVRKLQ